MTSTQKRIKKEIEKDFEYCIKTDNKKNFEFYFNYCYGLVMGAGFFENTEELGDWWDNEMNPKFRKEIAKKGLTNSRHYAIINISNEREEMLMTIELKVLKDISMDEIAKMLLRDTFFLPSIGTIIGDMILDEHNVNITSVDDAIDNLTRNDYIELFKALAEHLEKGVKANEI